MRRLVLIILSMLTITGCATYHFGTRSLYRPDIRSVHVPVVRSESFRRNLGERLTEAIVKEIETKTPYKVVSRDAADSVLIATIVTDRKFVLAENRNDEPRDIEVDLTMAVQWLDRSGNALTNQFIVPVPTSGLTVWQQANFVPEVGQSVVTAQEEAIQKAARQIVAQLETAW